MQKQDKFKRWGLGSGLVVVFMFLGAGPVSCEFGDTDSTGGEPAGQSQIKNGLSTTGGFSVRIKVWVPPRQCFPDPENPNNSHCMVGMVEVTPQVLEGAAEVGTTVDYTRIIAQNYPPECMPAGMMCEDGVFRESEGCHQGWYMNGASVNGGLSCGINPCTGAPFCGMCNNSDEWVFFDTVAVQLPQLPQ